MSVAHVVVMIIAFTSCAAVAQDEPSPADRTAAANATKAEWDAKKAELDYRNSANPASGLTGKVDVKANAGTIEANILATKAVQTAAKKIVDEVSRHTSAVVLLTNAEPAALARWDLFEFRNARLINVLDLLKQDLDTAMMGVPPDLVIHREAATLGMLSLASKALSYGLSDYEIGGVATSSISDETLSTAIAASGRAGGVAVSRPVLLPAAGGPAAVFDQVDTLERRGNAARDERKLAKSTEAALLKKAESADAATAKKLKEQAALFNALAGRYDVTLTALDALMTMLGDTSDKNPLPLAAVVREKLIFDALDRAKYGLFVSSPASGGGYYTKKNLWTALGGMPFYVAGGAVVNFSLVERATGDIKSAGVVSVLCGYRRVAKSPSLDCEVEPTPAADSGSQSASRSLSISTGDAP